MTTQTLDKDNQESIIKSLKIKPVSHGAAWSYQIRPLQVEVTETRINLLIDSLKLQGNNLIPLNIRRIEEDGEYEYECVTGNDWLLAANEIGFEKLIVNVVDITKDQVAEFQSNYNQLLGITTEVKEIKEVDELSDILGEDIIDSQLFTPAPKTPKTPAPKAPKTPKTTTPKSNKITSYEQFKRICLEAYHRLNTEYNLHHLVPIYRLRRDIGDRVTRTEFNNWLLQMQANDIFQLMAGEMPDITPEKREDSLILPIIGAFRY
ncbi:MAG TPA: hypothetical protein V6C58_23335, partial [Allocoleopsis sp.]